MVPLEKVLRRHASEPERRRARPVPQPARGKEPAEAAPARRFRVIDSLSREVLVEDADPAATIELLRGVQRPVDVSVYVWEPQADDWRLLTRRERSLLWDRR